MKNGILIFTAMALLAGCAQQEEPMVAPEPVYDKYGNVISAPPAEMQATMIDADGDGIPETPVTPEPDDDNQNRNRNQNQNTNQNTNQNNNQNQNQGG